MSLHNLNTTITPAERNALDFVLNTLRRQVAEKRQALMASRQRPSADDDLLWDKIETAELWLKAQNEKFFQAWEALPQGSHLKEAYSDQVWYWSDRDLVGVEDEEEDDSPTPNFIQGLDIKPERPFEK